MSQNLSKQLDSLVVQVIFCFLYQLGDICDEAFLNKLGTITFLNCFIQWWENNWEFLKFALYPLCQLGQSNTKGSYCTALSTYTNVLLHMLLLYYGNTKSDILIVDHYRPTRRARLRRPAMGEQLNHIYSSLHTHTHASRRWCQEVS